MDEITPWTTGKSIKSPFALPTGFTGSLAGRLMRWMNRHQNLSIRDVLDVQSREHVLEIGYGPGGLIRALALRHAGRICGVDPSSAMRAQAEKLNRTEVAAGRVQLQEGTADNTGYEDEEFDCVVSVNNVAMWPNLEAGMRELHRVTRPGGRVVVAWHGGNSPSRTARQLQLPTDQLNQIESTMNDQFTTVERQHLEALTVFSAQK